jgi:hypothetical protein
MRITYTNQGDIMAKHICDKEVILQKITDDLGYIKKALTEDDDGGIIAKIKENTNFRIGYEAKTKVYKFMLGSGWAITFILFLSQLYININ